MDCIDDNTMLDLVDGTLDAAARDRVLRHIETCAACRRTVASSIGMLAPSTAREPDPPPFTIGRYVVLEVSDMYAGHVERLEPIIAEVAARWELQLEPAPVEA